MRIGTKLIVSLVLSVMIMMGFYHYWRLTRWHKTLSDQQAREVRIITRSLKVAIENAMKRDQWEDVEGIFREIKGLSGIDRITLFHPDGSALAASDPSTVRDGLGPYDPADPGGKEGSRLSLAGKGPEELPLSYPDAARVAGSHPVLEVVASASSIEQVLAGKRNELILTELLIVVTLALATWYFTRRNISRPIGELAQGAMAIGSGELSSRIPVKRKDELGHLAAEFNRMAENLEHARGQFLEETRRKLDLERQLQHSEKLAAVGRLAAGLAHEIGTPLNVISGRAEYLLPEIEEDDPKAKSLRVIIAQIERISRIVEQLLGYARAHPPQIAPTLLPPVLASVLFLLDHELKRRSIRVELEVSPAIPDLATDPYQLQQVFVNLLLNALDAMPEGGRVCIGAEAKNGWVEVGVEDTGCGISAENLQRIFDPFFTTKRTGKGTGLGLSVVYGIIQNHGGRIEVRSEVGVGTSFVIHLPCYR